MDTDRITTDQINDDTILINPGRLLDNNNAHEMSEAVSQVLAKGFSFIIVDMSRLEFISSAGVGSILGAVELFRDAGGDLVLCNASENIVHILKVLDLVDYLTLKNNRNEAEKLCRV